MRVHGGNPPPGVIDFSSSQNPLPHPEWLQEELLGCVRERVYTRYYDPELREIKELLAELDRVEGVNIHVANGSAEILAWLPAALKPEAIVVVEPNFGDHEIQARALEARLHRVTVRLSPERISLGRVSLPRRPLIVLSRPNNPTGMTLGREELEWLEDEASRLQGWLVVDEAFQPLSDVEPHAPGERTIILRTLTKSLSTPGLRLGYAYSQDPRVVERLEGARQPWPLDAITLCTYTRILSERMREAREYIREGREASLAWGRELASELESIGLRVYRSRAPFLLVRHPVSHPEAGRRLNMLGVHVRDAGSFHGLDHTYSRVSVRSPPENRVLVRAFQELTGGQEWGSVAW